MRHNVGNLIKTCGMGSFASRSVNGVFALGRDRQEITRQDRLVMQGAFPRNSCGVEIGFDIEFFEGAENLPFGFIPSLLDDPIHRSLEPGIVSENAHGVTPEHLCVNPPLPFITRRPVQKILMFDGVGEGLSEEPDQFASFRFAHVFEFLRERFPVNFVEAALTDKFRRTHGPAVEVLLMKFGIFGRRRMCQLWSSHWRTPL